MALSYANLRNWLYKTLEWPVEDLFTTPAVTCEIRCVKLDNAVFGTVSPLEHEYRRTKGSRW